VSQLKLVYMFQEYLIVNDEALAVNDIDNCVNFIPNSSSLYLCPFTLFARDYGCTRWCFFGLLSNKEAVVFVLLMVVLIDFLW
jgi:hypothetical protein